MAKQPTNLAASVHKRLLNMAKATGRPFNELLQHYAIERLIYRLAASSHRDHFVLKGAIMMRVWKAPVARPTKDVDFLGRTSSDPDSVAEAMRDICRAEVVDDGLRFDADSVAVNAIAEEADYTGVRARLTAFLGKARVPIQVDVGFGDVVTPAANEVELETILDFPAPHVLGYTRETSIAEKLQVLVKLGVLSSRVKDLYDIWLLSQHYDFDAMRLGDAIRATFSRRSTGLTSTPHAFSDDYASNPDKQAQWSAYRRKGRLDEAPEEFPVMMASIVDFLRPVLAELVAGGTPAGRWAPSGPWT